MGSWLFNFLVVVKHTQHTIYHFNHFKCTAQWHLIPSQCCTALTTVQLQIQETPRPPSGHAPPLPPAPDNHQSMFCVHGSVCCDCVTQTESQYGSFGTGFFYPRFILVDAGTGFHSSFFLSFFLSFLVFSFLVPGPLEC
jgi:hypothetical protein